MRKARDTCRGAQQAFCALMSVRIPISRLRPLKRAASQLKPVCQGLSQTRRLAMKCRHPAWAEGLGNLWHLLHNELILTSYPYPQQDNKHTCSSQCFLFDRRDGKQHVRRRAMTGVSHASCNATTSRMQTSSHKHPQQTHNREQLRHSV